MVVIGCGCPSCEPHLFAGRAGLDDGTTGVPIAEVRPWRGTRRGAAGWAALIDEWHDSGLSLPAFCQRRGLNLATMQGWVYKRGHRLAIERPAVRPTTIETRAKNRRRTAFLPVHLAEPIPATGSGIELVLAAGRRIVVAAGFDPETLRRVVAVLEGRPC